MKEKLYPLAALLAASSMFLTACGSAGTTDALTQKTPTRPTFPTSTTENGPVVIRWSIGIGDGTDPAQVSIENAVAQDFNASQSKIQLVLEVVPKDIASDSLATEIAAGVGPDIVGPVDWFDSNAFSDQWLDLDPLIAANGYDISKFDPAMVKSYQTDTGTVGVPFVVYPSAIFYNTDLFTKAGLNPLPAKYGDQYPMPDGSMVDWTWDTLAKLAKLLTIDSAGKHSGEAGFDKTRIVQYGFSFGWESAPNYWATFMSNGGSLLWPGGSKGSYVAKIPDTWKTAWQWVYDGMYGADPYIPDSVVTATPGFDYGNVFVSGKVGMLDNPSSYLCCIGDLTKQGDKFEFGSMPVGLDGKVAGRVDEETFRIWKGSKNPKEAFTVLTYLVDTGIQKLVVGSPQAKPAYGGIPGVAADRAAWLASQKAVFPYVKNWDTLLAGLDYPDIPSAKAYMPNMNESWARLQTFGDLLSRTKGVDLATQETRLESDLTAIFNK